jgi:hypothetical protein
VKRSDSKILVSLAILLMMVLGIAIHCRADYFPRPSGGSVTTVSPFTLAMASGDAMSNCGGL